MTEPAVEVIDGEMAKLEGQVTRRPADEVMEELEAAEDAAKEARREMRERKRGELSEELSERIGKLKERLHIS